ncbi:MAG: hypothetical protein VKK80_05900 [Prochlorothrix sp.]|nr:hypothetical protein [Prochlorothrix sp.]
MLPKVPKDELQAMIPGLAHADHFSFAKIGEETFVVVYKNLNSTPELLSLSCRLPQAA